MAGHTFLCFAEQARDGPRHNQPETLDDPKKRVHAAARATK